ncbi:unnamed protein product [Urochloa decumbens]|uniref:Uncharacterized protein n=1 Tax=Urochloa decumbens TaxID=240449 RepID=A0ABC9F2S8_9POAL
MSTNVPEHGAPEKAPPPVVAGVHGRLEEVRVVAGGQPVPLQRVPHVLVRLNGRPLHAWLTASQGRQPAQAKASPDPDGLDRGRDHLHLTHDLLQLRQVVQVDGGQLRKRHTVDEYLFRVHFVQHKDMREGAAVDDVKGLQAGEGGDPHRQHKLEPWTGPKV